MHAQNSRLWGVDYRCAKHGPKHSTIADGKGSSVHVLNSQLVLTGLQTITHNYYQNINKKSCLSDFNKMVKTVENITFSPNILIAFSMSAKFIASTPRITGTTRP